MAFGDSNDIKINVTVDTKAAIDAAKEINKAFEGVAKEITADFKSLTEAAKALSAARVAQIKKDSAIEVATIKTKSEQQLALLRKELETFKQTEVNKRADLEATYKKQIEKISAGVEVFKQAELNKRQQISNTAKLASEKITQETKQNTSASKERISGLKVLERSVLAEINAEVKAVKEAEATKRAEIKLTAEQTKLEAAKVRRETVQSQSRDGGGKAAAFPSLPSTLLPNLASAVFLFEKAAQGATLLTRTVSQLAEEANKVQALTIAFSTLQQSVGRDPVKSIERLRVATQGLISDTELYQKANQAVLLGVPTKLFEESAAAAVKLGRAMGIDAAFALESLSIGLGRQSRLYLDNLGIVVSATEAYKNFAIENNIVGRELNDAEKRLAFFNETSKQLRDGLERLPPIGRDVGIAYTELSTATKNARDQFLLAFNSSEELQGVLTTLANIVRDLTPVFIDAGSAVATFLARLANARNIPIIEGTIDVLGKLARQVDEIGIFSESAKRNRFSELAEDLKEAQDRLAALPNFVGLGNARKVIEEDIAKIQAEYTSLGVELDKIDTKRQAQKDLKIAARIDTEQLSQDAANTESLIQGIKQSTEEALGTIRIPGLDATQLATATQNATQVFTAIKQTGVSAEEAAVKVRDLTTSLATQINAVNIEATAKQLATAQKELAATPGNEDLAIKVKTLEKQLSIQKESLALDQTQREQLQKFIKEQDKLVTQSIEAKNKAEQEAAREAKRLQDEALKEGRRREKELARERERAARELSKRLKEQQRELKEFSTSLNRALDQAIPTSIQKDLVDIFNDPKKSAQQLADEIEKLGLKFLQAGGDVKAFIKEAAALKDLKDLNPSRSLTVSSEVTKSADEYNEKLKQIQGNAINLRDILLGESLDPATGKKAGGGFFGFDLGFGDSSEARQLEQELAGQVQDVLATAFQAGVDGFTREDVPQIAAAVGTAVGAAIGAYLGGPAGAQAGATIGNILGQYVGEALQQFGKDKPGTRTRKEIDAYFAEAFDGERLGVVIEGEVFKATQRRKKRGGFFGGSFAAITTGLGSAIAGPLGVAVNTGIGLAIDDAVAQTSKSIKEKIPPTFVELGDIVFNGFTRFAGDVRFGVEEASNGFNAFSSYFQTLPQEVQASFNGIGLAYGELLGVSEEQGRLIGVALANNIGGSLQNLQILVQATGESFEDLSKAILESFLNSKLSIDEAYNALVQLQNIYGEGIPGAIGAYEEAIDNLNTSLERNNPGRYAIDSLRDIGAEGIEAKKSFEQVIGALAQSFNFTAEQQAKLFEALRINGILSLQDLAKASNEQLLTILKNVDLIRKSPDAALVATPVTTLTPKTPSTSAGTRRKSPQEVARELLQKQVEEARKLLTTSQEYLSILDKINNRQIDLGTAGQNILKLEKELLDTIKQRDSFQKAFDRELSKGRRADKGLLADLAAALRDIEERLKKSADSAKKAAREYKQLNLTGILPLIKDQNTLGLVSRQVGISLEKNIDILVKGFVQGRLSIAQVNEEIKKTKDLLGPGIPGAVGDVTSAFQNLIDAGKQGGEFSLDAFTDIFAEFREKFNKESSELRKAEGEQLRQNVTATQAAYNMAVGPDALAAAKKSLDVAKKALADFYANVPVPELADLRVDLETAFGTEQVDKFFQAIGESGLGTFDAFENAGNEAIIGILGRLEQLGFKFNETAGNVNAINTGLVNSETVANAGLDPLREAINLVQQFNAGAGTLPPVFNSTTAAIDNLNGPLTTLANSFQGLLEKLSQLNGLTFENEVVFNVRTTGDAGGRALVETIFGDGSDIGTDTGGSSVGGNTGTSDSIAAQRAKIRQEMAKLRKAGLNNTRRKNRYNQLKERLRTLGG